MYGCSRPDEHPARPGDVAAHIGGGDLELAGAVQVPRRRSVGGEQFEAEPVGQVVRDARRREGADGAVVERRGEGGDVLVLDGDLLVADRGLGMAVGDAERYRALA